jgi:hypothetical protein
MKKLAIIAVFVVFSLWTVQPAKAAVGFGDLIKGSGPMVYYVTSDLKRVAFPDERTFRSWYADFSAVKAVSDAEILKLPFGGVAQFRPGVRPIKGQTDSRVYGIDREGKRRWLADESIARMIYGADWASKLAVVSDVELASYGLGPAVTGPGQYWWKVERDLTPTLHDLRFRIASAKPSATLASAVGGSGATLIPLATPTRIIILPTVINDNGGYGKEGDVKYFLGDALVLPQDGINVLPGAYTLYHGEFPGYTASAWSGDCAPDGTVVVPPNETRACFITFDDIPDGLFGTKANRPPMLMILANVEGASIHDAKFFIGSMQVSSGSYSTLKADDYTLYYVAPPGTHASFWGGDCTIQGTIALRNGDEKICTITFRR